MEQDEKFENQLNLALDLSEEERERSKDLDAGYDKETDQWEIIFRYAGTLDTISTFNFPIFFVIFVSFFVRAKVASKGKRKATDFRTEMFNFLHPSVKIMKYEK